MAKSKREIKSTKRFAKAYQRCKNSGFDMDALKHWTDILEDRDFTVKEKEDHGWHKLTIGDYPKNSYGFHVTGKNSNWEFVYQELKNGGLVLITLLNTGNHNQIYSRM